MHLPRVEERKPFLEELKTRRLGGAIASDAGKILE
jgi:hypothetical protein